MPVDTSIYNRLQPVQIESPLEAYGKVAQFQHAQQQNRLAELALGQKQREVDGDTALAGLLSSGKSGADVATGLAQQGFGAKSLDYTKQQAEMLKQQRAAEREQLTSAKTQIELIGQVAGAAKDPQSYAAGLQMLQQAGVDISQIPQQFDPAYVAQARNQALTASQQIEQVWKQKGYDLDVSKFGYQQQNDAANRSVAVRGQNLTDARGREANRLKSQENEINQQGIVGKKIQDVELKLQDDYRTESKGYSETATAMKKVLGSIDQADKNPGSALAAGTAFMKLLDPNSVVRESELGMALNASGWFDRATNIANTLQAGKVMTPKQKENLKLASETLFEEAKAAQREVDAAYEQRVKAYGGDPSRVIVDRGQKIKKPAPAAALPSGWSVKER